MTGSALRELINQTSPAPIRFLIPRKAMSVAVAFKKTEANKKVQLYKRLFRPLIQATVNQQLLLELYFSLHVFCRLVVLIYVSLFFG